jgi:hypothetical protein
LDEFFSKNILGKLNKIIVAQDSHSVVSLPFFGFAYQGKDIMFRFIIEYSSLRDFYRPLGNRFNFI